MTRAFGKMTDEQCKICSDEGYRIFLSLIEKHGKDNPDMVMNSLCSGLCHLLVNYVAKDDRPILIQVMHKILTNNS